MISPAFTLLFTPRHHSFGLFFGCQGDLEFKVVICHVSSEVSIWENFESIFDVNQFIWPIYNDLSRGHPKWWFSKGIPPKMALN